VRITVADNGPGIAAGDLARVFDPYFTTKRGGTGLGLPIAKNIVEGLGGTLGVSSPPGKGTDFIIELPFEAPLPVSGSKADGFPQGGPAPS
jgi:signal transduction histidine kinase